MIFMERHDRVILFSLARIEEDDDRSALSEN